MIESPQNEKLKLVRRLLRERKHRDREGLFATEGEDLLAAGLAAGQEPKLLLTAAGAGLGGEEVAPELLAAFSTLGSGTRAIAVWAQRRAEVSRACVYLHGVGDPGNVGTIVRTADALLGGSVALGPDCADPFSPKAVRASMGSIFAGAPVRAAIDETPEPRAALVAHGGEGPEALAGIATVCLGAERDGLPAEVRELCRVEVTIPLRPGGAESLNVAAAAAIACERVASAASITDPSQASGA